MHKKSYINFINAKNCEISEFKHKIIDFLYLNKKNSPINAIKHFFKCLKYFRKKIISIHFKTGEITLFNKSYNFKKIEEQKAKKEINKNRVAIFAHWDKDCLLEDYVIYYLKSLKNVAQKIIFVSDCDVKKEELEKLNGIADVAIAQKHGKYDFGSYKIGFLYAKENGLLKNCDELIFANDSCYAPLFPFKNMFEAMGKKQADFWGNTISDECVRHVQSYFYVFNSKVFNSEVFNNFAQNINGAKSKKDIIQNYELKLTKLLEQEGFKYASYCKEYKGESYGLHIRLWRKLIKEDKSPFLKTSLPRFRNTEFTTAMDWKKVLKKYTDFDINLIKKDLKRNRKASDILKEIFLVLKHIRRKIIKIHLAENAIYLFGKRITKPFKLGVSYNLFDGEELLEASIKSIRSQVDYINVIYQNISNYGNKSETDLKAFLESLIKKGLVDEIYLYEPNLDNTPHRNEKNKRNIGLKLAKKRGCTHFASLDTDEFYNASQLAYAKEFVKINNIECSAVSIIEYIKKPSRQIVSGYTFSPDSKELYTFYVPFIMKIKWHKQSHGKEFFPCLTDPTRTLNGKGKFYLFPKHEIAMHHMSSIRKDLYKKYLNSSIMSSNEEIQKRVKELQKDISNFDFEKNKNNLPDFSYFEGNLIRKVENTFHIPEELNA